MAQFVRSVWVWKASESQRLRWRPWKRSSDEFNSIHWISSIASSTMMWENFLFSNFYYWLIFSALWYYRKFWNITIPQSNWISLSTSKLALEDGQLYAELSEWYVFFRIERKFWFEMNGRQLSIKIPYDEYFVRKVTTISGGFLTNDKSEIHLPVWQSPIFFVSFTASHAIPCPFLPPFGKH